MADFGILFFICNIVICVMISALLLAKRALKPYLSSRMQFHLWFLMLGFLSIPFLPLRPTSLSQIFLWLNVFRNAAPTKKGILITPTENLEVSGTSKQINDFALSVSRETPSLIGHILCAVWLIGILAMIILVIKSQIRLNALKKSALPLQNKATRILYESCLDELKIKRYIPVFSTAFLKSPIIVGLWKPCIYLPIHLISDFNATDMRYMLLHELQHYKHKDAFSSYLMNLFGILYWFNPLVWYALKEMRNDRELACDASVLGILEEKDYEDYGNTLINFAEKISLTPFPFAAGISGSMKQMEKRIISITSYKKPTAGKRIKGSAAFAIIAVILSGFAPMLSTYAADQNHYDWKVPDEKVSIIDLSSYYGKYEGSFALYDQQNDSWHVYDMDQATLRTAPNSTYKIYDALFGLEEGIITPYNSSIAWNGQEYPFAAWNTDQNLSSAMDSSVNWYFQEIDNRLGASKVSDYVKELGYGNENTDAELSSYWMQSALKISPIEQVALLTRLYNNDLDFTAENINAVKDSICLFSSEDKNFYGKTGTGRVDGHDVNGWFVGYAETDGNTYFFATNIQNDTDATGSNAAEITMSILSDMNIWE